MIVPLKPKPPPLLIYCDGCYALLSEGESHKFPCPKWFRDKFRKLLPRLNKKQGMKL